MLRPVRPLGQRPVHDSRRCSWGRSFTSQVIASPTETLARAASRSGAAFSACSSLPANGVRLIRRRSGGWRARLLTSSMFCRLCVRGEASCFTVGTVGTDPVASRLRCSSCWPARSLAGSSRSERKATLASGANRSETGQPHGPFGNSGGQTIGGNHSISLVAGRRPPASRRHNDGLSCRGMTARTTPG